ncbi:hypothetical protein GYMLUDRAFT_43214 [Collybiopsis luxurians FD-317 M1]|uniref:Uncharacterized protein n=1 Tax=Collybiopsis luxurians FD-317 M1 TaxID=944289 RepID=A0A0D0CEW4_9AGAR|nr:hypothetical protein GYMLUDRAFT_43214 [Collybiopsis luxurians FD-317 M1]
MVNEYARRTIQVHTLWGLWPHWPMLGFGDPIQGRCSQRREMWSMVGKREIQWRISSIYDTFVTEWSKSGFSTRASTTLTAVPFLYDLIIDLLEFSGSSELDEETCFRALRSMHKLWSRISSVEVKSGLRMYIDDTPKDYAQDIFTQLIRRLTFLLNYNSESEPFFQPCHQHCLRGGCPLKVDGVIHFLHRLSKASKTNEILHCYLVGGDILRLLDAAGTHLFSCGALSSDGAVNPEDEDTPAHLRHTYYGPRYRILVLSMAWESLQEDKPRSKASTSLETTIFNSAAWTLIKKHKTSLGI